MVSNWTGSHLGRDGRKGAGLSVLVVAVGCICVAAGAARAQTCPTGPCTTATQATDCEDGLFCTQATCILNVEGNYCFCPPKGCDDNLFCTIDSCNETFDRCDHTLRTCSAPTPYCDEDLNSCVQCLEDDHCTTPTTPPRPLCDTSSGTCVQCLSDFQCQDAPTPLFCNGYESCNSSTGLCQAGTPPVCKTCVGGTDNGQPCSTGADCASPGTCTGPGPRTCFRGPTPGATCTSDANCGTGGKCPGLCFMGPTPGAPCSTNADCGSGGTCGGCSELRGACVQCDHDSGCDDGKFCNGGETCQNDQCAAGTPPVCKKCVNGPDNLKPCSTNADCGSPGTCTGGPSYCDEVSNRCVQCLNASQCEDFNFCTSNACLWNSCVFTGSSAICSDGLSCNGQEICNYVLGNACSNPLFGDRTTCCFHGVCSVPKSCTTSANCPSGDFCSFGVCSPHGCTTNADCPTGTGTCVNSTVPDCNDDISCTVDSCNETNDSCQSVLNDAACSDGHGCTGTETCKPTDPAADPVTGCKPGTPIVCSSLNPDCSEGVCLEQPTVHCQSQPINQGAACDDDNPCTVLSKCNNGSCVDNPPAPNDPYRCVKLEWRASGPTTVLAGSTVQLSLYAVANGCNTSNARCVGGTNNGDACSVPSDCPGGTCFEDCPPPSLAVSSIDALLSWNKTFLQLDTTKTCVGGAVDGITCTSNANCRVCVGGSNPGTQCTSDATCLGGGTCPVGGTCATVNPADSCVQPDSCRACPADEYPWGFSGWINDCITNGDRLNDPCSGGLPANDGNARYLGFQGLACSHTCRGGSNNGLSCCVAPPCQPPLVDCPNGICSDLYCAGGSNDGLPCSLLADCPGGIECTNVAPSPCATTTGLQVTTIKFKAISGGTSQIAFLPCFGAGSKTQVQSPIVVIDVPTSDVTKSLGPAVTITVTCDSHDDCNDNNVCTNDSCNCTTPNCGGTCQHVNNTLTCNDGLFCTTNDRCASGVCQGGATPCAPPLLCDEANDRCVQCLTVANCNDGVGCTVDTCVNGSCQHAPVNCHENPDVACTTDTCNEPNGTCTHTPSNAFCNPTGLFCSSAVCDLVDDCVFEHECISTNGNPCLDPATCNEGSRTCGGCKQPTAVGIACRYLAVTPAPQGSTPIALRVIGECHDTQSACVARYVQSKCNGGANNGQNCLTDADCPKRCAGGLNNGNPCTTNDDCPWGTCAGRCDAGTLGSTPFYKTASQWGTAMVRGAQIRPSADYLVETQCDFPGVVLSAATSARTWKWGDIDGDGDVDGLDIVRLVDAFKGIFGDVTFEQVNIWGCTPDGVINALDITLDVDAFKGFAFPCGITCP